MPSIKEKFKQGLKSAAQGTTNAFLGSPEDRKHQADVRFKAKDAERRGFEAGLVKGSFQKGYAKGRNKARNGSSNWGMLGAGMRGLEDGLNATAGIFGADIGQHETRQRRKHRNRRNSNRESGTIIF